LLSERIISNVLGVLNRRYLATDPVDLDRLPAPPDSPGFVLYAHVPFCERLCTYCSFNRFIYKEDRARAYFSSLRDEMRMVRTLGYDFASLYVGGGTPTILLDELAETIDLARELFPGILEVSAETSPNHLGPSSLTFSTAASSACRAGCKASTTGCCGRWTASASTAQARRSSSESRRWRASSPPSTST